MPSNADQAPVHARWELGAWQVVPAENRLLGPDGDRLLEPRVMTALEVLLEAGGGVIGDDQLMAGVWGRQIVSDASLYKVVAQLRKALGDSDKPYRYIERVSGKGYRLLLPARRLATDTRAEPPAGAEVLLVTTRGDEAIPATSQPPVHAEARRPWRWAFVAGLCLVLAALLVPALYRAPEQTSEQAAPSPRVSAPTPAAGPDASPTSQALAPAGIKPAAWDAYLLGRWHWARRQPAELSEAEAAFRRAIAEDPNLALAYVGLCDSFQYRHLYGDWPQEKVLAQCEPLLREALRREPELGAALASFGLLRLNRGDEAAAEAYLARARRLAPDDATVWMWSADVLRRRGQNREALGLLRKAEALDPLSGIIKRNLAATLFSLGEQGAARREFAEAVLLEPDYVDRPVDEIELLPLDVARARAFLAWAARYPDRLAPAGSGRGVGTYVNLALIRLALGDAAGADTALKKAEASAPKHPYVLYARAVWWRARGEIAQSRRSLEARLALQPANPWFLLPLLALDSEQGRNAEARARFLRAFPAIPATEPDRLLRDSAPLAAVWLSLADPRERERLAGPVADWLAKQTDFDGVQLVLARLTQPQAVVEKRLGQALAAGWLPFPGDDFYLPEQAPGWQGLDPVLLAKLAANRAAALRP